MLRSSHVSETQSFNLYAQESCPGPGCDTFRLGARWVAAFLDDLNRIEEGAQIRFIIGRFGAGKGFFFNLARMVALERKFVVAQADLALEFACKVQGAKLGVSTRS